MAGGICILGISGLAAQAISKYGFDAIFSGVIKELYKRGESKETIIKKIESYKISKELMLKLKEKVENFE